MSALPEVPPHIYRRNAQGLIEAICIHTGNVIAVQCTERDLLLEQWDRLIRVDTPSGPVFLEKGISFDILGVIQKYPFSKVLAGLLCESIMNGATITQACKELNLPKRVLIQWRLSNEEFAKTLAFARCEGADALHDEALQEARNPETPPKVRIEALQWSAEKNNPDRYGSKTKIVGDPNAPIAFVLETGIRRQGDAGFVPPAVEKEVAATEVAKLQMVEELPDASAETN
jgi:hypothetical protein